MELGPKGVVLAKIFEADLENGREYYNKIRKGAVWISCVGEDNADDFVQDFYLSVLRAAEGYRYDIIEDMIGEPIRGNLNTWLWNRHKWLGVDYGTKLLKNRSLSLADGNNRDEDSVPNSFLGCEDDVSAGVLESERSNIVLDRVYGLPALLRDIAICKYYVGMSSREIADAIGSTTTTVYTKLREIKDRLSAKRDLAFLVS